MDSGTREAGEAHWLRRAQVTGAGWLCSPLSPAHLPRGLGSYFALTVRLELSQLQGNRGILAACGEGEKAGEGQAVGGCPGQGLCDCTCGEVARLLLGMTQSSGQG